MLAAFLKYYLLVNFLLVFTILGFNLLRQSFSFLRISPDHQSLVRCAQLFILLAVSMPLLLPLIPGKEMPMPTFMNASEGSSSRIKQSRPVFYPKKLSRESEAKMDKATRQFQWLRSGDFLDINFLVFSAWLLGFFFFAVKLLRQLKKLRRLLSDSLPIRKLGLICLSVSPGLTVPISVYRWGKRWVIFPESLLTNRLDLRLALKHELQHHRQGDTLWALAVEWIVCFFYLNPAVYVWKRQIVELQEFSCDEALVGQQKVSAREYGSCLVRVAETALGSRDHYVGTTYMAANTKYPSFLRRRIEMLVKQKNSRINKMAGMCIGTIGVIASVTLAYGVEQSAREVSNSLPNPGTVVVNNKIQKITMKILRDQIRRQDASEGFAIVADPQTGKILAVANIDTTGKKTGHWALSEQLTPASIFKPIVVAEALEQNKTTPSEKHFCENGKYKIGDRIFHDWKKEGWENLSTTEIIANSSDIGTVKIAEKLGMESVLGILSKYGIGSDGTAKNFPESRTGITLIENGQREKFYLPLVAYGQGYQTTAIELIQAYGAFANGGNLLMPLQANAPDSDKKIIRRVLSEENAKKMKGILQEVVQSGTGKRNAGSYLYSTAGKTGSFFSPDQKWLDENRGTRKANMAGFIGFAPVNDPKVEIYVMIRDPKISAESNSGAHGGEHAAPVFKHIAEAVLQEMKVKPDNL